MTIKLNDPKAQEWLASQAKKSTRGTYKSAWLKFAEFTHMTGEQVLESRKQDKEKLWEKKVLAFKQHLLESGSKRAPDGFAPYSATLFAMAIRAFFAFYEMPLSYRQSEKRRLKERVRKTEDYRFSLEDLRKLSDIADLQERYVIIVGKSLGLRAGDFLNLRVGDLQPHLDEEPPIGIGPLQTQKESVQAYPFIDSGAKPVIKLWLEKIARDGRVNPQDKILSYTEECQLSRVLKRTVIKAGINTGNKIVRFHCLRKFLTDRLSSVMAESKWKMIVGKQISESAYVSPDELRKDYKRAMAETCFTKALTSEDATLLARAETLKMLAKLQGLSEEDISRVFKMRKTVTTEDEIKALQTELTKEKAHKDEDCKDGEHCGEDFKQIPESELLSFLKQGWAIVKELQNGEVIIKNR